MLSLVYFARVLISLRNQSKLFYSNGIVIVLRSNPQWQLCIYRYIVAICLLMEASYRNKFQCIMRRAFSTPTKRKLTLRAVRQLQLSALQGDYPCNSFSAGDILRARRPALFLRFSRRSAELMRPEHLIRRSLRHQNLLSRSRCRIKHPAFTCVSLEDPGNRRQ